LDKIPRSRFDATTKQQKSLTVTLNLSANEIKFRANDGWDLNLGNLNQNLMVNIRYGGDN
jgi:hypothetical protein